MTKSDAPLDLLDEMAAKIIKDMGGEPVFKGYQPDWAKTPFPATVCMSVDYEICHGIPGKRILKEGSIITYDVGVRYKTGCGDAALTVPVGEVDNFRQRLLRFGPRAVMAGVEAVKAGAPVSVIGKAIDQFCLMNNCTTIKQYGGHQIGAEVHEKPDIPSSYYATDDKVFLEEGKVICIEPMLVRSGYGKVNIAPDGWTAYEITGQPACQFEHMVLITKDGYEVLTKHF